MNNCQKNYRLLLVSQFWSALGDNFILVIILGPLMTAFKAGQITAEAQSVNNIYYTSLLFVPYVALAPFAGYFNDRFAKSRWLLGSNFIKLVGTGIAALSLNPGFAAGWKAVGYFVVGIGACIYSPAKYGILPEMLSTERLVKANGTMELLTLVAILGGSISGALAFDNFSLGQGYLLALGIYAISLVLNLFMDRSASHPEVRFRGSTGEFFRNFAELFSQRRLARVLTGTALFWVCGAVIKMNFQPWGQQVLKLPTMTQINLLGLWLSIGLMVGSVLAGQLYSVGELQATRRNGWLLAAALGFLGSVGTLMDHGLHDPKPLTWGILIFAGLMAGLFLIPLNAALQAESHKDKLGKTLATQNGFENLAMLCGSFIAYLDVKIGFNPSQLLVALAVFVALVVTWLKIPAKEANAA